MDRHHGDLLLEDEDRLPWLEPASPIAEDRPRTRLGLLLAGAAVLGLLALMVVGGLWLTRDGGATDGAGALIAAPAGPYKVRPTEPGGMEVEGQGDRVFAASQGIETAGAIDLDGQPEAPVAGRIAPVTPAPPPPAAATRSASAPVPPAGAPLRPVAPEAAAASASATGGGRLVQLGSFNSEARAREAWTILTGRFTALDGREPQIATGEVAGRRVYRLRIDAASPDDARGLCQRLRVGGEACLVLGG